MAPETGKTSAPQGQPAAGGGGVLIVLSGPSGAGKSTIVRRVVAAGGVWLSVSMTTRAPRPGEEDGRDYIFVTREEFDRVVAAGGLLEHATVHGESYGTPRAPVARTLAGGRDVLLEIDVQGARQVREADREAVLVFVAPPSREVLERRLRDRRSETEDKILARLKRADEEVRLRLEYDYLVVNDVLERAVEEVLAIISAERNRMRRRGDIPW